MKRTKFEWRECPTCGYTEKQWTNMYDDRPEGRPAVFWMRWGNGLVCSFECMKINKVEEDKT